MWIARFAAIAHAAVRPIRSVFSPWPSQSVFLIENAQNRDAIAMQVKPCWDLEELDDDEFLERAQRRYRSLRRRRAARSRPDLGGEDAAEWRVAETCQ
jgi:hypothetical protein